MHGTPRRRESSTQRHSGRKLCIMNSTNHDSRHDAPPQSLVWLVQVQSVPSIACSEACGYSTVAALIYPPSSPALSTPSFEAFVIVACLPHHISSLNVFSTTPCQLTHGHIDRHDEVRVRSVINSIAELIKRYVSKQVCCILIATGTATQRII